MFLAVIRKKNTHKREREIIMCVHTRKSKHITTYLLYDKTGSNSGKCLFH